MRISFDVIAFVKTDINLNVSLFRFVECMAEGGLFLWLDNEETEKRVSVSAAVCVRTFCIFRIQSSQIR